MSKLRCPCGHVIVDNSDSIPYKARILPDEKEAAFFKRIEEALRALLEVNSAPARERWLARFGFGSLPARVTSVEMCLDLVSSLLAELSLDCYECTACGRVHVERRAERNVFSAFVPDGGAYESLLSESGNTSDP